MAKKISFEVLSGIVAIIIFIIFALYMFFAVNKNSLSSKTNTYYARFNDIDGITIGSDVKISGYKVGSVSAIDVIPQSYDVKVTFSVQQSIQIPTDTTIAVRTSGILGGKFLAILPGADETFFQNKSEILYTQSAINLENLIGSFVNK